MPFGKANSSKIFCFWVQNWCRAFRYHFKKRVHQNFAIESYVDDIFGGADTKSQASQLKIEVIRTGIVTSARANFEKCLGPAQCLKILGMMYDAITKRCFLPPGKILKYITRINEILRRKEASSKEFERLVGNLVWASYVEPWGRPFLSALSSKIKRFNPYVIIPVTDYTKISLLIWRSILKSNRGLSYNYILGKLERGKDAQFVDASTSQGIGGCSGYNHFMVKNYRTS